MPALIAMCVIAALHLAGAPRPGRPEALDAAVVGPTGPRTGEDGWLRRWRWAWALLAGAGTAVVLGGPLAAPAGAVVAGGVGLAAARIEPRVTRLRREEVRRDLPHVVTLLAAALRSGVAPAQAIGLVCRALPGAAADRLVPLAARLELGGDPVLVWTGLPADDPLAPLGRTLARAHRTGAPIVAAIERLAEELAQRGRAEVEDRARSVGVRAAVPLGLCLLPSFLLLGIVPLAVSLAAMIG